LPSFQQETAAENGPAQHQLALAPEILGAIDVPAPNLGAAPGMARPSRAARGEKTEAGGIRHRLQGMSHFDGIGGVLCGPREAARTGVGGEEIRTRRASRRLRSLASAQPICSTRATSHLVNRPPEGRTHAVAILTKAPRNPTQGHAAGTRQRQAGSLADRGWPGRAVVARRFRSRGWSPARQ
jgi:hypothetical protein